jgi:hypothetical protein
LPVGWLPASGRMFGPPITVATTIDLLGGVLCLAGVGVIMYTPR